MAPRAEAEVAACAPAIAGSARAPNAIAAATVKVAAVHPSLERRGERCAISIPRSRPGRPLGPRALLRHERPGTKISFARRDVNHLASKCMERVWDYPRPPAVQPSERTVRIELAGRPLARSERALRVLETSHPPTIYLPRDDIELSLLSDSARGATWCEFKGRAQYLDAIIDGRRFVEVGWFYPDPSPGYEAAAITSRSIPVASTAPGSATSGCSHRRARSMAAGSRPIWSGRSRVPPARSDGERPRGSRWRGQMDANGRREFLCAMSTRTAEAGNDDARSGSPHVMRLLIPCSRAKNWCSIQAPTRSRAET